MLRRLFCIWEQKGQGDVPAVFLLWLLLSGGVSVHTCLWGAAVSALITWFCRRVLGYEWHILLGDPRRLWAMARYFAHLLVEMLKAAGGDAADLCPPQKHPAQAGVVPDTPGDGPVQGAAVRLHHLTAGTITVLAEDGRMLVHAWTRAGGGDRGQLLQQRLERMEASQWSK